MQSNQQTFEQFMKRREDASQAFVEGDAALLEAVSAHTSPASIFGPQGNYILGADEVNAATTQQMRAAPNISQQAVKTALRFFTWRRMTVSRTEPGFSGPAFSLEASPTPSRWTCMSPRCFAAKGMRGSSFTVTPIR